MDERSVRDLNRLLDELDPLGAAEERAAAVVVEYVRPRPRHDLLYGLLEAKIACGRAAGLERSTLEQLRWWDLLADRERVLLHLLGGSITVFGRDDPPPPPTGAAGR
jgi:hypothetical protein